MQIHLKSCEVKSLDNAVKEICKVAEVTNVKLLHRGKLNTHRRIIIYSNIKVSVITQLELPEVVNISIKA